MNTILTSILPWFFCFTIGGATPQNPQQGAESCQPGRLLLVLPRRVLHAGELPAWLLRRTVLRSLLPARVLHQHHCQGRPGEGRVVQRCGPRPRRSGQGRRLNALVTLPLVVWVVIYFGWIGGNFVTSMRYFLPLYAAFAALAAYGLVGAVNWANARRFSASGRFFRSILTRGALVAVAAFTIFWALAFANIYRHQATYTQAGHWVWENLPADFAAPSTERRKIRPGSTSRS